MLGGDSLEHPLPSAAYCARTLVAIVAKGWRKNCSGSSSYLRPCRHPYMRIPRSTTTISTATALAALPVSCTNDPPPPDSGSQSSQRPHLFRSSPPIASSRIDSQSAVFMTRQAPDSSHPLLYTLIIVTLDCFRALGTAVVIYGNCPGPPSSAALSGHIIAKPSRYQP